MWFFRSVVVTGGNDDLGGPAMNRPCDSAAASAFHEYGCRLKTLRVATGPRLRLQG